MLYANLSALCFIERKLLPMEVLHCGNRNFQLLDSCDPSPEDLHIRTWPVFPGGTRDVCKYELPTSRLSKVIGWHTQIQTYRHDRNYIACSFADGKQAFIIHKSLSVSRRTQTFYSFLVIFSFIIIIIILLLFHFPEGDTIFNYNFLIEKESK